MLTESDFKLKRRRRNAKTAVRSDINLSRAELAFHSKQPGKSIFYGHLNVDPLSQVYAFFNKYAYVTYTWYIKEVYF